MPYDNTNSGALFRDENKKNPKGPDYTGKLNVEGTEWRLAGWLTDGKNGKYLSIKVTKPLERKNHPATPADDDMEPIPF